jgi:hypothetical protein
MTRSSLRLAAPAQPYDERGLTLTKAGRDLLDSHALERDDGAPQAFHAGVCRPREVDHDSNLYSTYRQEEAGLREKHVDPEIRRVVLEQDLKREYQAFLQEPNRNRPDSDSAVHRRGMTGGRRRLAGIVGSPWGRHRFF